MTEVTILPGDGRSISLQKSPVYEIKVERVGVQGRSGKSIQPKGAWTNITYSEGDLVTYNGRAFVSFADGNLNNTPPSADADDAFWMWLPATQGPAGEGFVPRGEWDNLTNYDAGDFVSYGPRTFVSFTDGNIGHQPPSSDVDDAYWMYVPTAVGPQGDQGLQGNPGNDGLDGTDGDDGWSPVLAAVADGNRRVHQVADWVGGDGTKPATGDYVGPLGLTPNIGDATDVRGASGAGSGDVNTSGSVTSQRIVRYSDATGDVIEDSGYTIADVLSADNHTDGTTNKVFTATEKTKLAGIANGATANTGTVTSVGVSVPTGFDVASTPVTASGTIAITFTTGYSLPTTVKQGQWDTAYGWGDHSAAGYLTTSAAAAAYQPLNSNLTSWAGVTRASGFDAFVATPSSANLRALLTDETGTGIAYFVGGALGTPASGTATNLTGLPIASGVSGLGTGVATFLATPSSANLRAALTDEVGTGAAYFVGGALGTPASGTATNLTGLPAAGVVGTAAVLTVEDQNISGGARVTIKDLGNLSGASITPDPGDRPTQKVTNNGNGSILPGSNYGSYRLLVVNTTGAGTITTTGWILKGDSFDTTTSSKFLIGCDVYSDMAVMVVLKVA